MEFSHPTLTRILERDAEMYYTKFFFPLSTKSIWLVNQSGFPHTIGIRSYTVYCFYASNRPQKREGAALLDILNASTV